MKWFKHISDSLDDPFIFELMAEFGADGYLVFFGILEIYSREFKVEDNWKLSVTQSYLTQKLHKRQSTLVIKILKHIQNSGKWEIIFKENKVIIFIPKFTELIDEWSKRKLGSKSVEPPKILNTDKDIRIKNKEEDNKPTASDDFILPDWIPEETWKAYLEVRNKKKAAKTNYALNLVIKELLKIQKQYGQNPVDVLNKSITSGWADVYPLKENKTTIRVIQDDFTNCVKCGHRRLKSDVDENGICLGRCENASAAL